MHVIHPHNRIDGDSQLTALSLLLNMLVWIASMAAAWWVWTDTASLLLSCVAALLVLFGSPLLVAWLWIRNHKP